MKTLKAAFMVILLLLIAVAAYFIFVDNDDEIVISGDKYSDAQNFTVYTITELKQKLGDLAVYGESMNAPVGEYNAEGYVVYAYDCPPCPAGRMCEPCAGPDSIIISENYNESEIVRMPVIEPDKLQIPVKDPSQFEVGKKYVFSFVVEPWENNDGTIWERNGVAVKRIRLVGYSEVK